LPLTQPNSGPYTYIASSPVRLIVGVGKAVGVQVSITNKSGTIQSATCTISVSGYMQTDTSSDLTFR
jgi:hypothetical protein